MIRQSIKTTVLVIAAHPDDEVLGCGGTIGRLTKEGHEVYVSILGEGITSRYKHRIQASNTKIRELRDSCHEVAKILGVKELFTFNLPDNRFDTVPLLDIIKIIEELIEKLSPHIVYTHNGGDLNIDHRITYQATLAATRPLPGTSVKEVCTYEVPSSTEWSFQSLGDTFRPNIYVDIKETLELKIQAMNIYESELRNYPHPRSPEVLRTIAHRWGSVVCLEAVEVFESIREIR